MSDSKELQITKRYGELKPQIDKMALEEDWLIRPGRWLISSGDTSDVRWVKVLDMYYKEVEVKYRDGEKLETPEIDEELMILVENEHGGDPREYKWDYHKPYNYIIVDENPEDILEKGLVEMDSQEFTTPYDHDGSHKSESTALAVLDKTKLTDQKERLMMRRDHLEAKRKIVMSHVEQKLRKLRDMKGEMMAKIGKLKKIIHTIEVYLGINEDIDHIIQGEKASEEVPITFRQKILYMDEEVGDPTDGGWDFKNVGDFYDWLESESGYWEKPHYGLLIPEEKCVVVFQIRRKDKKYSDNPFVNFHMNRSNKQTMFAIRNGGNVWVVWADIRVSPRLFPGRTEIQEMIEELNNTDENSWSKDRLEEKIENETFRYQLQFLVLQGLIERKDIFGESVRDLNLLKTDTDKEDKVRFVYDDTDPMLDDAFGNFKKWRTELNEDVSIGSRILYLGNWYGEWSKEWSYHLLKWPHWNSYPYPPGMGIYTLKYDKELDKRYFKYLPGDSVWDPGDSVWDPGDPWEWGEVRGRKNRVSYYEISSLNFINYDALEPEDFDRIEYALHSRVNRQNYWKSIPTLQAMLEFRKSELKEEDNFISMIYPEFKDRVDSLDEFITEYAKPAISWWKFKNKYKQSLVSDDAKAVRMITKRIKRKLK